MNNAGFFLILCLFLLMTTVVKVLGYKLFLFRNDDEITSYDLFIIDFKEVYPISLFMFFILAFLIPIDYSALPKFYTGVFIFTFAIRLLCMYLNFWIAMYYYDESEVE